MTFRKLASNYLLFFCAAVAWTFIDRFIEDRFIQQASLDIAAMVLGGGFVVAAINYFMWLPVKDAGFREVEARCGTAAAESVMRGLADAKAGRLTDATQDFSMPVLALLDRFRAYQEKVGIQLYLELCKDGSGSINYTDPIEFRKGHYDELYEHFDSIEELEAMIA